MKNLLKRLFCGKEEQPKARVTAPLLIEPYNGGVVINGLNEDDYITVGMTESPDPADPDANITTNLCIVTMYGGEIERNEPNAVALLHELACMLGYTVSRQKSDSQTA